MPDTDHCLACEGQNPNTWIFTHLAPFATIHSCEQDASINLVSILASLNKVDFNQLYAAIEAVVYPGEAEYELRRKTKARKATKADDQPAGEPADMPEEQADAVPDR